MTRFSSVLARAGDRDAIELDLRANGEAVDAECAARRISTREVRLVDLVELTPLGDIREHHGALHEIAQFVAVRLERGLDIAHGLLGLFLDAARHQLERARFDTDLPG